MNNLVKINFDDAIRLNVIANEQHFENVQECNQMYKCELVGYYDKSTFSVLVNAGYELALTRETLNATERYIKMLNNC